jgi:hypothetical protein
LVKTMDIRKIFGKKKKKPEPEKKKPEQEKKDCDDDDDDYEMDTFDKASMMFGGW